MKTTPLCLLLAACLQMPALAAETEKPAAAPASAMAPQPAAGTKLKYEKFHVNSNAIAITFDDGPHPKNTPRLLDMLKERGIKATFFLIGKSAATYPEIVRRIVAEGHELGNHTWDHKSLRAMSQTKIDEELQKTQDAIVAASGTTPLFYRPPGGQINKKQMEAVMEKFHYPSIVWEVDTNDWRSPRSIAKVHDTVMKETHAGSIILCHDIHVETVDAMPTTLDDLKKAGFEFKTISEMIKLEADEIKAVSSGKPMPGSAPAAAPAKTEAKPADKK